MKKQRDQQLVRIKTLVDSNDDDDDMTSTSSISNDNDSEHSSKITHLMRENERKIRNLSDSYMNRFLMVGQQLQTLPQTSNALALPSSSRLIVHRKPSGMDLDTISSPPSLTLFIETLKQLIIREEKKRGLILFRIIFLNSSFFFVFKKKLIYLLMMKLHHQIYIHVFPLDLHNVYVIMKVK